MKPLIFVLSLAILTSCTTTITSSEPITFRSDVLYYPNTFDGRAGARDTTEVHGGRQEVQVVDQKIPVTLKPYAVSQTIPQYSPEMLQYGVEGNVIVDFIIDESGNVFDAVIVKTDSLRLNEATLNAVRMWKFMPARREGVGCRCRVQFPINFGPHK